MKFRMGKRCGSMPRKLEIETQRPRSDSSLMNVLKPRDAAEKKQLEKIVEIGGQKVTLLELRKQLLIELVESTALKVLLAMGDPDRLAEAKEHQLAISFGVLVDKARLLKGEPTAIYRHEDIRKLDELGAAIMSEMKRRGISIEGDVVHEEAM